MENVINNTEPMPSTPQGSNGKWVWNGDTTARHRSLDGKEWLLKGAWRWVQEQRKDQAIAASKPVNVLAKQFKSTATRVTTKNNKLEKALGGLALLCGVIIAITLTLIIIN